MGLGIQGRYLPEKQHQRCVRPGEPRPNRNIQWFRNHPRRGLERNPCARPKKPKNKKKPKKSFFFFGGRGVSPHKSFFFCIGDPPNPDLGVGLCPHPVKGPSTFPT